MSCMCTCRKSGFLRAVEGRRGRREPTCAVALMREGAAGSSFLLRIGHGAPHAGGLSPVAIIEVSNLEGVET
eukprot:12074077-Alexandrium_andersonii.AAC.1